MKTILSKSVTVKKCVTINGFEIINICIIPNLSASVYLFLYLDDDNIIEKKIILIDDDYLNYVDDSYLFNYIIDRIEKIYNN